MYPIIFEPIYKETIWGGGKIAEKYKRDIPENIDPNKIGESWDISFRDNEMGIVKNGKHKGKTFKEMVDTDRKNILGEMIYKDDNFPLLVKIIDADDNLSVQVHPDDEYAKTKENHFAGKTEIWYILEAPENAELIVGVKDGVTKQDFRDAVEKGTVEEKLGKVSIKKGDVINIPSGLIHAITSGVMLAEIQQNSDITYRVYDYNRTDAKGKTRELHVEKALDVSDFEGKISKKTLKGLAIKENNIDAVYYMANKYFAIKKYNIKDSVNLKTDGNKFLIYTCVEGKCNIKGGGVSIEIKEGDSIFLPAALGEYEITGKSQLIQSFVPNIEKDFIEPLKENGFTHEEIEGHIF